MARDEEKRPNAAGGARHRRAAAADSVADPSRGAVQPGKEGDGRRRPPMVFHALRLLLGAVFLYASYDKILHPEAFAQAIYNYQILPDAAINMAALILPWLEALLGLCLIAGVWLPGATVVCTGLLAVFIGALVFNLARGLDIHCGCFSTEATGGPAGAWTVARDTFFLALAVYLTSVTLLRPRV